MNEIIIAVNKYDHGCTGTRHKSIHEAIADSSYSVWTYERMAQTIQLKTSTKQMNMASYYDNRGALLHEDSSTDIEEVKKVLEEKDLCIAVVECDGKRIKVQRGRYKEIVLIHRGKAYLI